MSRIIEREIPCPHCGAKQNFPFYEVVNVREDPQLFEKVTDGSIFDMNCPMCRKNSRIGYPMLYHDPDHNAMVIMSNEDSADQLIGMLDFLEEQGLLPKQAGECVIRGVHQPPELAEKALIFREGLDDRGIELMKAEVGREWAERYHHEPRMILLTEKDQVLYVALFPEEAAFPVAWPFEKEDYLKQMKTFGPFMSNKREDNLFVNKEWVQQLLSPGTILH